MNKLLERINFFFAGNCISTAVKFEFTMYTFREIQGVRPNTPVKVIFIGKGCPKKGNDNRWDSWWDINEMFWVGGPERERHPLELNDLVSNAFVDGTVENRIAIEISNFESCPAVSLISENKKLRIKYKAFSAIGKGWTEGIHYSYTGYELFDGDVSFGEYNHHSELLKVCTPIFPQIDNG